MKTLNEHWERFEEVVLAGSPPETVTIAKLAFYGGIASLLASINDIQAEAGGDRKKGAALFNAVNAEFATFNALAAARGSIKP